MAEPGAMASVKAAAYEAYMELKEHDPNHELLGFLYEKGDGLEFVDERWEEFNIRFPDVNPNSGLKLTLYTFTNFCNALQIAAGKPHSWALMTDKLRKKYGLPFWEKE